MKKWHCTVSQHIIFYRKLIIKIYYIAEYYIAEKLLNAVY